MRSSAPPSFGRGPVRYEELSPFEREYADRGFKGCGKKGIRKVDYYTRARFCPACTKTQSVLLTRSIVAGLIGPRQLRDHLVELKHADTVHRRRLEFRQQGLRHYVEQYVTPLWHRAQLILRQIVSDRTSTSLPTSASSPSRSVPSALLTRPRSLFGVQLLPRDRTPRPSWKSSSRSRRASSPAVPRIGALSSSGSIRDPMRSSRATGPLGLTGRLSESSRHRISADSRARACRLETRFRALGDWDDDEYVHCHSRSLLTRAKLCRSGVDQALARQNRQASHGRRYVPSRHVFPLISP